MRSTLRASWRKNIRGLRVEVEPEREQAGQVVHEQREQFQDDLQDVAPVLDQELEDRSVAQLTDHLLRVGPGDPFRYQSVDDLGPDLGQLYAQGQNFADGRSRLKRLTDNFGRGRRQRLGRG